MSRPAQSSKFHGLAASLLLLSAVLCPATSGAAFPDGKPVTLIVSFDPGSTTDLLARTLAPGVERALGTRLVIENKGGGGGTVAMALLATAKPDGYTVAIAPTDTVVYTPLMQKVPFSPLKSFTPILAVAAAANTALIVNKEASWKTFQEFVDFAKKNPGRIKYSTAGVGTGMHVAMEVIAKRDGIKWTHIPYKSAAAARTAMMGGHVDACSAGAEFVPFAREGVVRVLATHGEKRSTQFPDSPTLSELGYEFEKETIHTIFGPANLPPETLQKLEAAFVKASETPEFKALVQRLDCAPAHLGSKDLTRYVKDLWGRAEKMFKEGGVIKEAATQP